VANVIQFTVRAKDENTKSVFGGIMKSVAAIGAAIGGIQAAKQIGASVLSFEKLRLSINTVSDSAADAQKNMKFIEDFAKTTPFDLNQVTDSFIKMKALGLDPSEEALRAYGDTASAMGKSLNQMIEAVADASTGEFERLKEVGIKARNEGQTVAFTFNGITENVANNSEAIEGYLQRIGQTNFSGAMSTQANSVVGAVSNMWDAFNRLAVAIGDSGIRPLIRSAALAMTSFIEKIIEHKDTIRGVIVNIVAFGIMLKQVFTTIIGGIKNLMEQDLATALKSIGTTLMSIAEPLMDWAVTVVKNIGMILVRGFPIALAALVTIFQKTFVTIGQMMGNVMIAALASIITIFKEFGAAINDVIQNAILGIDDDRSFGEILSQRFSGAFQQQIDTMKLAAGQLREVGAIAADELAEGVRQISEEVGPLVGDAFDNIAVKTQEVASALTDIFGISMEEALATAEGMTEAMNAFADKANEMREEQLIVHEELMTLFQEQWQTFIDDQGSAVQQMSKQLVNVAKATSKAIGQMFASVIVEGKSLSKGLEAIAKQVLKQVIAMLVELGVQRLIAALINKSAATTEASTGVAKNAALTFSGQFQAMSQAPWPVNLTAPAVAAAMTGAMLAGTSGAAASGAATGGGLVAAAHGGLDFVPSEQTYLLDRGERVLSPKQNTDLTDFLSEQGAGDGGRSVNIERVDMSVLENVTDLDSFMNLTPEEVKEIVADKIIVALDSLDDEGVRPAFVDRTLNQ
jgi:hypothetical protein